MGRESRLNPLATDAVLQPVIKDALGRVLQEGDKIVLTPASSQIYYRVVSITPVLDANAPPNLMRIEIAAAVNWVAVREQKNAEFLRVQTAEEAGPMNVTKAPTDPGQQERERMNGEESPA